MSRKIGEIITDLLQKVGIDHTDKQFADIISIQTEVPETVAESFRGLMTEQAAKNNISIKNHFVHAAYNPLDKELHSQAEIFELSDDQKAVLEAEKSTGKKQKLLFNMLQENWKQKVKAKDPEAESFKKEIDDLRKKLADKETEKATIAQMKDKELKDYILGSKMESEFGKHPWSDNYPAEVRNDLAKISLNKYLENNGAKLVLDENKNVKIVKSDNEELEYFDNSNKKLIFTELVSKLMADNKYLRVSQPTTTIQSPVATGMPPVQPTTQSKSLNRTLDLVRKAQQDQGL